MRGAGVRPAPQGSRTLLPSVLGSDHASVGKQQRTDTRTEKLLGHCAGSSKCLHICGPQFPHLCNGVAGEWTALGRGVD
jgi:hypothetical protein